MITSLLALVVGITVGGIFGILKLPIPAPPELPGIMGIVGIYIGFKLISVI